MNQTQDGAVRNGLSGTVIQMSGQSIVRRSYSMSVRVLSEPESRCRPLGGADAEHSRARY